MIEAVLDYHTNPVTNVKYGCRQVLVCVLLDVPNL
jgi:hypothetical protein